jgi:hypothetical protein
VIPYVVAHSWIGALVAVILFLGVFLYMRKRQVPVVRNYGTLEMKEGAYRDEPVQYRDDDNDETNGNGII